MGKEEKKRKHTEKNGKKIRLYDKQINKNSERKKSFAIYF